MEVDNILKYSMQIAMLKQLWIKNLIDERVWSFARFSYLTKKIDLIRMHIRQQK